MFTEHGRSRAVDPLRFGDLVVARKDMPTSYHLAVVVDDAFQNVTLVTRGEDLLASTHIQRVLQALLDLPAPSYAHHRLILDETGKKFSKRDGAVTLTALREAGATPSDIRARLNPCELCPSAMPPQPSSRPRQQAEIGPAHPVEQIEMPGQAIDQQGAHIGHQNGEYIDEPHHPVQASALAP